VKFKKRQPKTTKFSNTKTSFHLNPISIKFLYLGLPEDASRGPEFDSRWEDKLFGAHVKL
jgi:hypothetical protein